MLFRPAVHVSYGRLYGGLLHCQQFRFTVHDHGDYIRSVFILLRHSRWYRPAELSR